MKDSIVSSALERAVVEAERAATYGWSKPNGEDAGPNLQHLLRDLQGLRTAAPLKPQVRNLIRWVGDWIPDLGSPLMNALGDLERAIPDEGD